MQIKIAEPGAELWLVAYNGEDGVPYACAFSTRDVAERFAATREGEVIATSVDRFEDMAEPTESDIETER